MNRLPARGARLSRNGAVNVLAFAGISAVALGLMVPATALAQTADATYTSVQAAIGAEIYQTVCSFCHQVDLTGNQAFPELAGPMFRGAWGRRPVSELLELVQSTMPPQAAGSLTAEEAAAVVAHILESNEVAAGATDLTLDSPGLVIPRAECAGN